jgi:hypothetical protein
MKSKIAAITAGTMLTLTAANPLAPALARDNFSLNQLLLSIQESPQSRKLVKKISNTLRSSKTSSEQVQCAGTKLSIQEHSLSDARLAPFDCHFPNNITLTINAQNFVILPSGRATPLENAKNFNSMPKPISLSYRITSWNWNKIPD